MTTEPHTTMATPSLTLIVATTSKLGIGLRGSLPWRLPTEMKYFARVTSRRVSPTSPHPNAVIMGRKTWDSIPPRFRPLRNRVNVVLSRSKDWVEELQRTTHDAEEVLGAGSLTDALKLLAAQDTGRIFVIGGAEVYREALELDATRYLLVTRVEGEWECDTFLPVDPDGDDGWVRASEEEWRTWTGEIDTQSKQKDGDTEFEYRLYSRKT